jgi:branched-chain amino acid aminotransferase
MIYINRNGQLENLKDESELNQNRGFSYGDALFDVLKFADGKLGFIEDHYFRLMSSMRMLRMKIPNHFTLEGYEKEILSTLEANSMHDSARVRVSVFRKGGGQYTPDSNQSQYLIEISALNAYKRHGDVNTPYEIELFKDYQVPSGLLSTIKTNNRLINVLGSVFAKDNGFSNVISINERKELVGATNANLFLVKKDRVLTPSLESGCINGIIRKKVIEHLGNKEGLNVEETAISPFELLKVDEVFLTNSIIGVQSVDKYRKKDYDKTMANELKRELFLI